MDMSTLRELLVKSANQELELESLDPTETVHKAIIIREFMKQKNIPDVRHGIREFFAFQRQRLQRMGWTAFPPQPPIACAVEDCYLGAVEAMSK